MILRCYLSESSDDEAHILDIFDDDVVMIIRRLELPQNCWELLLPLAISLRIIFNGWGRPLLPIFGINLIRGPHLDVRMNWLLPHLDRSYCITSISMYLLVLLDIFGGKVLKCRESLSLTLISWSCLSLPKMGVNPLLLLITPCGLLSFHSDSGNWISWLWNCHAFRKCCILV